MSIIKTDYFSDNTKSKAEILLFIILIIMALPFFVLAFYNHPSADDYCIASMIKNNSFWDYQKAMYNTWTGRYFANFTEAIYTSNINLVFASKLVPFILLCLLFTSFYLFLSVILKSTVSKFRIALYTLILFVVYLNIFPSTGEGIYWITGATEYLFANVLTLFFLTLQIKLFTVKSKKNKILFSILSVVISLMAIGLNEINLCSIIAIVVLSIIYRYYLIKKIDFFNILILVFVLIFCYVEISAPGNYSRAGEFSQRFAFCNAIKISAVSVVKLTGIFIQNTAFLLISLIYIPLAIKISDESSAFKNIVRLNPVFVFICSALLIFFLYFPATFTMGINPPLRVHSTIAMFFILLWFFNITVAVNHYFKKLPENNFSRIKITLIIWIIIIISISTDFYKEPGKQICFRGNIFRASYDLFFKAANYDLQMNERYSQIFKAKKSGNKSIEFKELDNIPTTIFFIDISQEKNHWINSCYSQYYDLDTIALKSK